MTSRAHLLGWGMAIATFDPSTREDAPALKGDEEFYMRFFYAGASAGDWSGYVMAGPLTAEEVSKLARGD